MTIDDTITFKERSERFVETHSPLYRNNKHGHLIYQGPSQDGTWWKPVQQTSSEGTYVAYRAMPSHSLG